MTNNNNLSREERLELIFNSWQVFIDNNPGLKKKQFETVKKVAASPNDAEMICVRGCILSQYNEFLLAESHFNMALELDPLNGDYYHNRGIMFLSMGQINPDAYNFAMKDLKNAIAFNSNNPQYHISMAMCQLATGDKDNASISVDKAVAINPKFTEYYKKLGLSNLIIN